MVRVFLTFLFGILLFSCKNQNEEKKELIWKSIEVNASAYNSVSYQTSNQPNIAAWGDTLKPGMKCIAVSRNLLTIGINHNTKVKINGLDGIYLVKDKMNKRWENKIDIYMGENIKNARDWGTKKVTMQYAIRREE
jgi:3D (Asp-Asp-Asp) domain-containing protein